MNIQIFGKNKCFASKAAERFFKERHVAYQFINIMEKGFSPRELDMITAAVDGIDALFEVKSPLYEKLNVAHIDRTAEEKKALLLEYPGLCITPVVRDCDSRQCTIGEQSSLWKSWLK